MAPRYDTVGSDDSSWVDDYMESKTPLASDCEHLILELETSDTGCYLTGNYHCSACGEAVPKNQRDSPLS